MSTCKIRSLSRELPTGCKRLTIYLWNRENTEVQIAGQIPGENKIR